ncbi:MAG: hypothetical protein ACOCTI_05030 [Phycisphaeraceae bacterium]
MLRHRHRSFEKALEGAPHRIVRRTRKTVTIEVGEAFEGVSRS